MDHDAARVTRMPGPVRPPWGELDAVVRRVLADGGGLDEVLAAADEVALEEDLDPRRAADRARAIWSGDDE